MKLSVVVVECFQVEYLPHPLTCSLSSGLVSCTSIDWFTDWPDEALYEVAIKQLGEDNLIHSDNLDPICKARTEILKNEVHNLCLVFCTGSSVSE